MKKLSTLTLLLSVLFINLACSQVEKEEPTRVLIIAFDGISVEGYHASNTPNLDKLMEEGSYSFNTRVVMPSYTLPNWTSHLTGAGPEQHGVINNRWNMDNITLPAMEVDEKGYFPSIYKILKDQVEGVKTAFIYGWDKLIYPYNQDYIDLVDYKKEIPYPEQFDLALEFMKENRDNPTFIFLYNLFPDEEGHRYGWMSPEYIASIEEGDVEVGKLLEKLKAEGLYEGTHIFFTSDHGGVDKGHGGLSVTEMEVPWSLRGPGVRKGYQMSSPNNTVNTAATVAHLFGCQAPEVWVGKIVPSIFE